MPINFVMKENSLKVMTFQDFSWTVEKEELPLETVESVYCM